MRIVGFVLHFMFNFEMILLHEIVLAVKLAKKKGKSNES